MDRKIKIIQVLAVVVCINGCSNTRYITDQKSIELQHQMHAHRSGVKVGDILLNATSLILSVTLGSEFEITSSDRAFKQIILENESTDSMTVNMVTDIEWKDSMYCDIMGIRLPPKAKQKLLVPYPAAYNVYFHTPSTEEERIELRTDNNHRVIKLKAGMTVVTPENSNIPY